MVYLTLRCHIDQKDELVAALSERDTLGITEIDLPEGVPDDPKAGGDRSSGQQ